MDFTSEHISTDVRELSAEQIVSKVGGFKVFKQIDLENNLLEKSEIEASQTAIANAVEEIVGWASVSADKVKEITGFDNATTIADVARIIQIKINDQFTNSTEFEVSFITNGPKLDLSLQLDIRGNPVKDASGNTLQLSDNQKKLTIKALKKVFEVKGILDLGRDSTELDKMIEDAKTDPDIAIALKNVAALQQEYLKCIYSLLDTAKINELGKEVQKVLTYKEDGSMRGKVARFIFGDITAGKNTLTDNLGITKDTFITGDKGVSNPGPAFGQLKLLSRSFRLVVENQGFNNLMDLIALPSVAARRLEMEDPDAPMVFDGYPRSSGQADAILSRLPKEKIDVVYMEVRNEQIAVQRTINRMLHQLYKGEEIRSDDLNSLAFYNDPAKDEQFRIKLKKHLESQIEMEKILEEGEIISAEKIDKLTEEFIAKANGRVKMAQGSRYHSYRKSFPGIIEQLKARGINTARIVTDNLTRDGVRNAFIHAVGTAYLPDSDVVKVALQTQEKLLKQEVVISAGIGGMIKERQVKVTTIKTTDSIAKFNEFINSYGFIDGYAKQQIKNLHDGDTFVNSTEQLNGVITFRHNNQTFFGTIVAVKKISDGKFMPQVYIMGRGLIPMDQIQSQTISVVRHKEYENQIKHAYTTYIQHIEN